MDVSIINEKRRKIVPIYIDGQKQMVEAIVSKTDVSGTVYKFTPSMVTNANGLRRLGCGTIYSRHCDIAVKYFPAHFVTSDDPNCTVHTQEAIVDEYFANPKDGFTIELLGHFPVDVKNWRKSRQTRKSNVKDNQADDHESS